jgi:hypothetical protein
LKDEMSRAQTRVSQEFDTEGSSGYEVLFQGPKGVQVWVHERHLNQKHFERELQYCEFDYHVMEIQDVCVVKGLVEVQLGIKCTFLKQGGSASY